MDVVTQDLTDVSLDFPSLWGVKFHNDDYTPMDFVMAVLMSNFGQSVDDAEAIMLKVHNEGEATVGVYTKDIAETKAALSTQQARQMGHPLRLDLVTV
jgi:ATP-dependent Clp protease adaptor protein ClpS